MDTREKIKKAWDEVVAKIGPIEGKDRKKITELAGGEPIVEDREYVECFVEALDNLLKAHDIFKRIEKGGAEGDSTMTKGRMGVKAAQIAAKRFQRRVDIAGFVLFSIYTPPELFIPLVRNEPLPKKRVNWKKMVTEWNQAHPSDTMTSTHVFRTTFYRIFREAEVLSEILSRELAETETFRQLLISKKEAKNEASNTKGGTKIYPGRGKEINQNE